MNIKDAVVTGLQIAAGAGSLIWLTTAVIVEEKGTDDERNIVLFAIWFMLASIALGLMQ
jgi:hypothetical protein